MLLYHPARIMGFMPLAVDTLGEPEPLQNQEYFEVGGNTHG